MHDCERCGKSFDSEDALRQHNVAKHGSEDVKPKKSKFVFKALAIVIVIIGVAIVAFLLFSKPSYSPLPAAEHVKGNGTIEILEFSDFQCPACGVAYPQAKLFLENSSDKVRFVYKHFPLTQTHPFAFKAAEASECAADQGKFWEYHDMLFENQRSLKEPDLIRYAENIGLDKESFKVCLDSGAMAKRIKADMAEGSRLDVSATPTFFISGKKFEGALTAEKFEQEVANA
ncbi:MAG TPA: DsbA family protein [Candidatus Nanoarchaeia archaeon]|nr:DsbA family protein [Candidatus Nanoarchaeia archaeon]